MKSYSSKLFFGTVCAVTVAGTAYLLLSRYSEHETRHASIDKSRPARDAVTVRSPRKTSDAREAKPEIPTVEALQDLSQKEKLLCLFGCETEPTQVLEYLKANNRFLMTDPDLMPVLMGWLAEGSSLDKVYEYTALIPKGQMRVHGYNYFSQILASPEYSSQAVAYVGRVTDKQDLSYLERYLPTAVLARNDLASSISLLEALSAHGSFMKRADFIEKGRALAKDGKMSMAGLEDLERLGHPMNLALMQGYIEQMVMSSPYDPDLLAFTARLYTSGLDEGELLAKTFKSNFLTDPVATLHALARVPNIEKNDVDSLISRNFVDLSRIQPGEAKQLIDTQSDQFVKNSMLYSHLMVDNSPTLDEVKTNERLFSDESFRDDYVLWTLADPSFYGSEEVVNYILSHKSDKLREAFVLGQLNNHAVANFDLAVKLVESLRGTETYGQGLATLLAAADSLGADSQAIAEIKENLKLLTDEKAP